MKVLTIILIYFFTHLGTTTIKPYCCEVSHQKLLFLGDVDDYIRSYSNFTCVGDLFRYWNS